MAITPTLLLLVAPTAFAFVPAPRLVPRTAHFSPRLVIRTPVAPVAFADQAGTLAGTFFQASLLPYIGFLYFLGYAPNNTPKQALFGFQFLLLFVLSTVFTGIVTKSVYGASLADTDWLHGAAEALLTTSNLYVASGFRNALAGEAAPEGPSFRFPALAIFALVVAATAAGPSLGVEQHSAFLYGIGNLGENPLAGVLDSVRSEPINALSLPTWAIHFSSVFEWLFAMSMRRSSTLPLISTHLHPASVLHSSPLACPKSRALRFSLDEFGMPLPFPPTRRLRRAVCTGHGQRALALAHVRHAAPPRVRSGSMHVPFLLQLGRRELPRGAPGGAHPPRQLDGVHRRAAHRPIQRLDNLRTEPV
jgi:hypothetical protein